MIVIFMVKVKREMIRSDTSEKAAPTKDKVRSERALIYQRYIRSKQFKEVREIVRERQNNICPICGDEFTEDDMGTAHHKNYRWAGYGGEKEADTVVLIHKYEHQMIHRHPKAYKIYSITNDRNEPDPENQSELAQAIRRERSKKK